MSLSTGIVESRDKGFVLNLKLLFTIVDCFLGRFLLRIFYCETSLFHWFSWVIISCLIYFSATWFWHDIDVCLFKQVLFIINLINNLGLKLINSINRGLNFPTSYTNTKLWTLFTAFVKLCVVQLYCWFAIL